MPSETTPGSRFGWDPNHFRALYDLLSQHTHILPLSFYRIEPNGRGSYMAMDDQTLRDPMACSRLETDGNRIMENYLVGPGPKIVFILHALLEEVLEDPKKNTEEYLDEKTNEMLGLSEHELKKLGESGKKRREAEEDAEVKKIMEKHHVC